MPAKQTPDYVVTSKGVITEFCWPDLSLRIKNLEFMESTVLLHTDTHPFLRESSSKGANFG